MLINRVTLTNYRIHSMIEVSFEKGINLLLGQNGSGKSSILEAIGLALFDADLRSSQADAIKKGEKSASILVEFTGNDGNDYIVEKKIGTTPLSRLYLQGDKSSRIDGKDAVIKKVMEVCGIISNEKKIFQNVITAYQNKIISVFTERPTEREKIFDTIFDTDIYRQIYDRYLKKAKDDYSKKHTIEENNILNIKEQLQDPKKLKSDLKSQNDIHKELSEKLKKIDSKLNYEEKAVKNLEKIKQNIEKLKQDITHSQELYNTKESEKNKNDKQLEEAEKSLAIIKKTKNDYDNYLKIDKRIKELSTKIDPLEKTETLINSEKEKLYKLNSEQKSLSKDIQHLNKEKTDKENALEKNNEKLGKEEKGILLLKNKYANVESEGKKLKAIRDNFDLQFERIKNLKNDREQLIKEKVLLEKELPDPETFNRELSKEKENQLILQKKLFTKEELERERHAAKNRLSETEKAEKILGNQTCPYLNEKCLNMENNSSPENYFKNKKEEIIKGISTIDNKLKEHQGLNKELEESIKNLSLLEKKKEQSINDIKKIDKIKQDIELTEKDITIARLEIKTNLKELKDYRNNLEKYFIENNFRAIGNNLKEKREILSDKYIVCREDLKNKNKLFDELKIENSTLISEIARITKEIKSREQKSIETNSLIKELSEKLKELQETIKPLAKLKEQRSEETELLEKLKNNYTSYLSHKTKAEEIPVIEKNKIKIKNELSRLKDSSSLQNEKLEKLKEQFSENDYREHLKIIEETKDKKYNLSENIGETRTVIASLQKEILANKQLKNSLDQKQKQLSLYRKKLDLTDKFRNNIKGMGKLVAKRLINQIAHTASLNYQKISGKNEEINWENSDKDSYTVYLTQGDDLKNSRTFEQLSGGEQVAVALALRAAMASILTKSHFAIFDEPTINLDKEKRIALAESTKYILKDLHQAIIVTHDDTFREMAQKTITLG